MKTYMPSGKNIERKWYVVDAEGQTLGRLASQVAAILRGKNKPEFTPFLDMGDYVIVVNAEKVELTGNKLNNKKYYNASQYSGGLRVRSAKTMIDQYPTEMFERVVWGMLPKGRLGRQIYKKLFVYAGSEHPHAAQQPETLEVKF